MFSRIYKSIAVVVFNTMVLFASINGAAWLFLQFHKPYNSVLQKVYSQQNIYRAYPNWKPSEVDKLLEETHSRGFQFDPYQTYREHAFNGQFVNVSEAGFRANSSFPKYPLDTSSFNVFVFGGSTTFGYGVPDSCTIASYLQAYLSSDKQHVQVYNFGQGGYFSNQELIWLERLISDKTKPNVVLFIDGLNEFRMRGDDPLFANDIRKVLGNMRLSQELGNGNGATSTLIANLPIVQLLNRLKQPPPTNNQNPKATAQEIEKLVARYELNCRLINTIAKANSIQPIFVIQPVPQYDYNLRFHLFKDDPIFNDSTVCKGYQLLQTRKRDMGLDVLWLGNLQHDCKENCYVDDVHYNPVMNAKIAREIILHLANEKIFDVQ